MELTNEFRVDADPATTWAVLTDLERIAPCMPGAQLQEVDGDTYRGVVKVKVGPITAQYRGTATFIEQDEAAGRAILKADGRETRGQGSASATITATLTPDTAVPGSGPGDGGAEGAGNGTGAGEGTGTRVTLHTDLRITGKVAQFGRGVIADVSANLLGRFVDALEATVLRDAAAAPPAAAAPAPSPAPAPGTAPATEDAAPGAAPATAATAAAMVAATAAPGPAGAASDAAGAASAAADVGIGPIRPAVVRAVDHPDPEPLDLLDSAGAPVARRLAPFLAAMAVAWLLRKRLRGRSSKHRSW